MAEEITYIPYGLDEISQLDLMTNLANGVEDYLGSKRWARKEKYRNAWLKAYLEIINRGLTGASNDSGVWRITHNGDDFPIETMSNLDREMYLDAAFYIQLQMARMTPKLKEEKKDEKLDTFNFSDSFNKKLLDDYYAGKKELFKDPEQGWNTQDKRDDKTGLRGIDNRRNKMIEALQSYKNSLEGKNFNFEGTSFTDINDAKNKILAAIDALKTTDNTQDDLDAFNTLGLNYRAYFSNGGNDIYGTTEDGKLVTYKQYYENKLKAAQEKAVAKKQAAYNNTLFITRVTNPKMFGRNAKELKEKYKDSNSLLTALQGYSQKDIRTLSPDELSEVQGAYRYLAKLPIDNKLLRQLQSSSSGLYKNAAPNRFRKIQGIDNLIWDSIVGQVIQVNTRQLQQAILNLPQDLFAGVKTGLDNEEEYLNSKIPGITNAEWKELSAIGLDIASILNPEAITGSVMALGAAGLRHSAKNDSNPDWDLGDYFWQGIDYLTGALGGIQVAGDLVLGAKTMATASKAVPILRKMARLGAWNDLYLSYPDLKEATRKITSGEELTVKDWRAIGLGIRGLVSHGRLNRGNRAERRVLEKSGQNITPENISSLRGKALNYSLKFGFTRTKPTNTSEVSIVKATVNGKESEIEISSNAKARIQEKVLKAGNSAEARNKAVKEVLESEGKVKASDKIEVEAPTYRDWRYVPRWLGTSRNLFGTKQVGSLLGNDVFNDYISGNRSYWDRYKYGSNTELKGIYNRLNINNNQASNSSTKTTEEKSNWNLEKIDKYLKNLELMESSFLNRDKYNPSSKSQKKIDLSKDIASEKYSLADGKLLELSMNNGVLNIKGPDGINVSLRVHDQLEIKKVVSNIIKNYNNSIGRSSASVKRFSKEYIESLKELRRKGYLFKYGGTLNNPYVDTVIKDFIKNNNI